MRKQNNEVMDTTRQMKVLVSVDEAAAMLSLGRTSVYGLVMQNELQSVKVGRMRRIVVSSLHNYISRLLDQPA